MKAFRALHPSLCLGLMSLFALTLGCATPGGQVAAAGPSASECKMDASGRQVCGYHCQMGSDGQVACANSADGTCAMGSDGHVACSQAPAPAASAAAGPKAECKMGSDGKQTCGFHCQMGSNGRIYCASTAEGACAMNSNGTYSCT